MRTYSRQFILMCLLVLTLLSTQLIQHSPLHDHDLDVVDCALCQFDYHDSSVAPHTDNMSAEKSNSSFGRLHQQLYLSSLYTPYQGRSPPILFS